MATRGAGDLMVIDGAPLNAKHPLNLILALSRENYAHSVSVA